MLMSTNYCKLYNKAVIKYQYYGTCVSLRPLYNEYAIQAYVLDHAWLSQFTEHNTITGQVKQNR